MRISTRGRYSLEALLYMALLPPGEYASTRNIAEHTGISEGYLEQLFMPLRKAGIIQGTRGPQGGYILARPATEITVGDILVTAEGALEPADCVHAHMCPREEECRSRHTFQDLYQAIKECVDAITLAGLVTVYTAMDGIDYMI